MLWQDENYRFVQIFTGAMANFGINAIALEPMSAEVRSVLRGESSWW